MTKTGWKGYPVMRCGSCRLVSEQQPFMSKGQRWWQCCACRTCWTKKKGVR